MEKDFMHIAFETSNSIFTPPVMKMTQSFSRFGREPTQTKDMGMAVPGDYYQGGVTAFSGGRTNFYPRGNLSSLSFQPMANLQAPKRDYDQHWETGGPNGWRCKVMEDQQQKQQGQQNGSSGSGSGSSGATPTARLHAQIMQRRNPVMLAGPVPLADGSSGSSGSSSSSGQQQQQQKDYTEFSFDKDGQAIVQSKDKKHYLKVNQKDKKVMLTGDGDSTIFGKSNAYLNSGSMCIVNPGAQGEESGAGWDGGQQGGSGSSGSGGSGTGLTAQAMIASQALARARLRAGIPALPVTATRAAAPSTPTPTPTPFASGGGGGGGGGGKVYLGGDPQKDKFCLVQTVCGPSKNVYAKI
jgi:hypothetical protein